MARIAPQWTRVLRRKVRADMPVTCHSGATRMCALHCSAVRHGSGASAGRSESSPGSASASRHGSEPDQNWPSLGSRASTSSSRYVCSHTCTKVALGAASSTPLLSTAWPPAASTAASARASSSRDAAGQPA